MKTKLTLTTAILATTLLFTACGGGGGSSSSAPVVVDEVVVDENEMSVPITEEEANAIAGCEGSTESSNEFITDEYCRNYALSYMKTSSAYVAGYTGAGVTIAVLDTGIDLDTYDINDSTGTLHISYTTTDYNTTTSSLEQDFNGARNDQIEDIYLSTVGSGYTTAPSVVITGEGSGASAIALLEDNGSVSGIWMTERGSGYNSATTTITLDDSGTGGSGAAISGFRMGAYDDAGHGTSVGGVAGGVKQQLSPSDTYDGYSIQGVAYNADIMSVRVVMNNAAHSTIIHSGIDYAVANNARIVNMSIAGDSWDPASYEHYKNAVAAGTIVVVAAGNYGRDCNTTEWTDSEHCQFPAAFPWLSGYEDILSGSGAWVVVGSVDKWNEISSFSNKAGVTKNNFLVAYGEEILSPSINDVQTLNYGTSFSAPAVSGAMALMAEKFPNLTGKEIAQIFFDSATDLGEPGCDDIYGHGLINIDAAFTLAATLEQAQQ
jgi:subtilisin family serine protease